MVVEMAEDVEAVAEASVDVVEIAAVAAEIVAKALLVIIVLRLIDNLEAQDLNLVDELVNVAVNATGTAMCIRQMDIQTLNVEVKKVQDALNLPMITVQM